MSKITANSFILPVSDLDAASKFYCDAFDLTEVYRSERIVFVGPPDSETAVGLLLDADAAGDGPRHVGFHLDHALDLGDVLQGVEAAGGRTVERGERGSGVVFARICDPDGNEIEI